MRFLGYGKEAMKGFGMSPDAYAQMAMQLAYYRLNGKPCGTYESIMTRGFLHGRTEVGRSTSIDALNFCQAFDDPDISDAAKVELLQTATTAHSGYLANAAQAAGCDRIMLGLKMVMTEDEAASEAAEVFTDPVRPTPTPSRCVVSVESESRAVSAGVWGERHVEDVYKPSDLGLL